MTKITTALDVCEMLVQWNDDAGDAPEMLSDCVEAAREAIADHEATVKEVLAYIEKEESRGFIWREIQICHDCYELKGRMCHNPECVFCRRTMDEVGQILDQLHIRPVIDGKRERL